MGGGGCQGRPSRGRSGTEPTQGGSADLEGRREGHGEPQDRDWGEAAVPSPHPPPTPSPYLCHGEGRSADDPAEEGSPMESQLHQLQDGHRHLPSPFPPPPPPPARPPPPHPTPHGAGLRRGPIAAAPSSRRCHRHRVCRGGWWSHSALWLSHPPPPPPQKNKSCLQPAWSWWHPSLPPSLHPSINPTLHLRQGRGGTRRQAGCIPVGGGCVLARECHQRRYRRDFTWTATTHQPAPSLLGSARQREPRRPTPPWLFPQRDGHRPSPATPWAAGVQRPATPRHLQTLRTEQPTTFY